jgi:hypothetical protein
MRTVRSKDGTTIAAHAARLWRVADAGCVVHIQGGQAAIIDPQDSKRGNGEGRRLSPTSQSSAIPEAIGYSSCASMPLREWFRSGWRTKHMCRSERGSSRAAQRVEGMPPKVTTSIPPSCEKTAGHYGGDRS